MTDLAASANLGAPLRPVRWTWLGLAIVAVVTIGLLYVVYDLYLLGEPVLGTLIALAAVGFALVYGMRRFYSTRFIYPGLVAIVLFVAFPVVYTVYLGFTNYSSFNLLTFERAQRVLMANTVVADGTERPFELVRDGSGFRVFLPEGQGGFLSEPTPIDGSGHQVAAAPVAAPPANLLARREILPMRDQLALIDVALPDGTELRMSGVRNFASVKPKYVLRPDGSLLSNEDGTILTPDNKTGFYVDPTGTRVPPGWRVNIGWDNFVRIFTSDGIKAPMLAIFVWTLVFATVSVFFGFAVGLGLATVLQWPHLRFKPLYRLLLILPYSVPGFISILVFKGIFNQNFGEVNAILNSLFGLTLNWNTDPLLAKVMIIIVNVWLGYPYMMLLAMGFLQSVPEDHKKAAALEGAGPLRVFLTITLPQILPPFLPLLISSFAFNFNNIVLILLLTRGLPDMPGTLIPAGQTDILGSFTYRISFLDSGEQFGLAGAITLIIFIVVTAIAYANFVALRRAAASGGT